MKKTKDKKEYRRAQAILKKGEGKEIAKEHGVNERTTQRWIAVYAKKGIEGLPICRSSRSKSRITDEDREIILSALFIDPHLFGYLRNTWSLRSLAKCLTNELGLLSCTVIIAIRACAHFHCLCFSIHCSYILSNSSTSASFSENVTITANFLFLLS